MQEYMIQARDNNGHWGHGDWRPTLEEARTLADERARQSISGKARVVHWNEQGIYFPYRVAVASTH